MRYEVFRNTKSTPEEFKAVDEMDLFSNSYISGEEYQFAGRARMASLGFSSATGVLQ